MTYNYFIHPITSQTFETWLKENHFLENKPNGKKILDLKNGDVIYYDNQWVSVNQKYSYNSVSISTLPNRHGSSIKARCLLHDESFLFAGRLSDLLNSYRTLG